MSAYFKGREDINTLLNILQLQMSNVTNYNDTANQALEKELRDIFIGYRDDELNKFIQSLNELRKLMPELDQSIRENILKDNIENTPVDFGDIGIGNLK